MPHPAFDADAPAPRTFRDGFTHANGLPAVPIVLGIAGHRNPRRTDLPALEASLQAVFTHFRAAYPDTPLVLLSSLAEGADQLASEVALANGVFVRAPLPFPADVFAASTSFDTEDGRKKLKDLLANPHVESFVVPLPWTDPDHAIDWLAVATDRQNEANSTRRRQCYANAGGYLVRHCDALIALWDGREAERPSGTAEHVLFKLTGRPPGHYPWTAAAPLGYRGDRGPVCVIHTPRDGAPPGSPPPAPAAGTLDVRLPSDITPRGTSVAFETLTRADGPGLRFWRRVWGAQGAGVLLHQLRQWLGRSGKDTAAQAALEADAELRRFRENCQAVDDFNRHVTEPDVLDSDVDRPLRVRLGKTAREAVTLFPGARQHRRWYYRLSAVRDGAAWLTGRRKQTCDSALVWLFLLLGASVALFHFYAHWFDLPGAGPHPLHRPAFYWLFLAALGAAVGLISYLWWERLDEQRLDYRALAETLRVRKAWAQAGLPDSVADSYLGQLRNEMSWVHRSLTRVCPPPAEWAAQFRRLTNQERFERLRFVRDKWVAEQLGHYRTNQRKEHLFASVFRLAGLALALAGWLLIPVTLFVAPASDPHPVSALHPQPWMLIGTGLLTVGAGLCVAFAERRSHEELSKQYERMRIVFEDGLIELDRQLTRPDLDGAQAVIRRLGHEAITEHAQWLILRRARPLELHF